MPALSELITVAKSQPAPANLTVDGAAPPNPSFAVKRSRETDITGRPGFIVDLHVNGAPVATDAVVKGSIPAGTALTVGDSTHRLREALDLGGGDINFLSYWFETDRFARTSVEPLIIAADDDFNSELRAALRRLAAIDEAAAFIVSAPNSLKGRQGTPGSSSAVDLKVVGTVFEEAFSPAMRTGIPFTAAVATDMETVRTVGVDIGSVAPLAGTVRKGWSSGADSFFPDPSSATVAAISSMGATLPPGRGIAVFQDDLIQDWADGVAVRFSLLDGLEQWARSLDEIISDRLIEEPTGVRVQTTAVGRWEISSVPEPTGRAVIDHYGRVWTVRGFEAKGNDIWHIEAVRVLGEEAA